MNLFHRPLIATVFSFSLGAVISGEAAPKPEVVPVERPDQLADDQEKGPGFLGVSAQALEREEADALKLGHGVKLRTVLPDSPAGEADLEVGDILTQVDDRKVASMAELRDAITDHKEGEEVTLKVVQDGVELEKKVTLAKAPERPQVFIPQAGLQIGPGMGLQGVPLQLHFGGRGHFQMNDADGFVELTGDGEGREVTVTDLQGEIVYEGPWVTPQDKAAPPTVVRKRIERVARMFGGMDGGFRRHLVLPPELDLEPAPPVAPVEGGLQLLELDFGEDFEDGFPGGEEADPADDDSEKEDGSPAESPPAPPQKQE